MKIDMHLHSRFSKRPTQWILQKIGCPESFSDPQRLYRMTQKMGFSAMTLTDHNTIAGCLEIAHLSNVFISEEVTAYFPDDRCKVHVLVYDINEAIHQDIQKVRENIFDLADYLNRNRIVHALAHPLFSINDRLTLTHVEKLLILFKTLELNGAREDIQNRIIRSIAENLTSRDMDELTAIHGLAPRNNLSWRKSLIGGSDDHSCLNVGRCYTEVEDAENVADFLSAIGTDRCQPKGMGASPLTLAHNLYGIAFQFFETRFNLERYANKDVLMRFLDRMLKPEQAAGSWFPMRLAGLLTQRRRQRMKFSDKIQDVLRLEGEKTIADEPELSAIIHQNRLDRNDYDEHWFRFVNQVSGKMLRRFGKELFGSLSGANVFSIFSSMGAAGSLYALMSPYFVSHGLFSRDRALARQVMRRFVKTKEIPRRDALKVAHFTDTFYEINGVALTLRQQAELAAKTTKDLTIVTCSADQPEQMGRVRNFKPLEVFELPEYPEMKLFLPPFLDILRYIYDNEYNYIHAATPGPVGLAALAASRILQLPITGTYHTAIPQYAARLTGDDTIEQLLWRYTLWFYDQMQSIYVPSHDTGQELIAKGISPDKIRIYPRGVDIRAFRPGHRNGFYQKRYNLGNTLKLLYVGRVSKEKNMPLLAESFRKIVTRSNNVHLVVVGDGPYLQTMKQDMDGLPCTFTGYLTGGELAEAYASADIFVFPSTTDTFGNVILEAQASGLPVIVTDTGGPRENIIPNETGLIVPGEDTKSFVAAVMCLLDDPARLIRMSKAARRYAEGRSFELAFLDHWKMYGQEQAESANRPKSGPIAADVSNLMRFSA